MYKQHSEKENRKIKRQQGLNIKKLVSNTLITAAVIEAVALPFMGFSIENFLLVLLISLLPVLMAVYIASSYLSSSSASHKRVKSNQIENSYKATEYEHPLQYRNNYGKSSKLVKLDKKNFNWNIDGQAATEKKEVEIPTTLNTNNVDMDEVKKRYNPYRSPFEPINPIPEKDKITSEAVAVSEIDNHENAKQSVDFNDFEYTSENLYSQEDYDEVSCIENEESYNDSTEEIAACSVDLNTPSEIEQDTDESSVESESESTKKDDRKVLRLIFKHGTSEKKPEIIQSTTKNSNIDDYAEEVPYSYPKLSLLKKQISVTNEEDFDSDIEYTANKLIETLSSFGVGAKVLDVSKGPSVTRYELQPNAGVKVSKIVGLADDIALNLAATGVRIEAPIPGKAAVGIEVPNKEVTPVLLRDVIESKEFQSHPSKLAFAVGKDVAGRIVVGDIAKMPHLLIAGATGSGKSVCINTLIASILYKASPKEVKLLMVDPKVVELGIYNGIPHLLIPVVTDPKKAAGALSWAVVEMTTRYKLFAENNVRDIKGYNTLMRERGEEKLPQIVIIIDELADLMMVAPNDVEDCICRLAQMARAAGMHLVIATQRPSVDVITGVIKANIPSRISFAVSSQIDSRTILDMAGAEKLLGRGDMLYNPIGEPKPVRLQGGYISDKEVEEIVSEIKSNFQADYDQEVLERINNQNAEPQHDTNDDDELLPQAIDMVFTNGQASASLIQRKFKVGYSRAARILDQMESWGVVGPADGSKPRQLLITKQDWDELNS